MDLNKHKKIETSLIIKSLNSLMGIIAGIVGDGELNNKEILFLKNLCDLCDRGVRFGMVYAKGN